MNRVKDVYNACLEVGAVKTIEQTNKQFRIDHDVLDALQHGRPVVYRTKSGYYYAVIN